MESQDGSHGGHLVSPNATNFDSNLAKVVPYHPLKFQIDWQKHVELGSGNKMLTDRQMNGCPAHQPNRWISCMQSAQICKCTPQYFSTV